MSLLEIDLTAIGQGVRALTAEEAAAYEAEKALRAVLDACGNGRVPDTAGHPYRQWKAADARLVATVGTEPGAYAAAIAWAEQYFDRVREVPRQTIAERVSALERQEVARG